MHRSLTLCLIKYGGDKSGAEAFQQIVQAVSKFKEKVELVVAIYITLFSSDFKIKSSNSWKSITR